MAYDKKTGTIITNGDAKQFERDMFRHFEEATRQIMEERPDVAPNLAESHEQYKKMNKASDDIEKVEAFVGRARAIKLEQSVPPPKPKGPSMMGRLRSLSRPVRAGIVFAVFWTAFVAYRTSDYHSVVGIHLQRWDGDDFFVNWLALPAVVATLFFGARWVMAERTDKPSPTSNPLTEFEKEIAGWPADQGKAALLTIKATLSGDGEAVERLTKELTVEQFRMVVETVKKMERTAK